MPVDTALPSVFEAGLPTLDYAFTATPADVSTALRDAQGRAELAIGPVGPEILSYERARAVLRDDQFGIPPGISLIVQGVTSGPLYDKVMRTLLCMEGEEHQRLRKLVSKAFTPRATARLHDTIVDVVNDLVDGIADAGHCDVVTDIARPYPIPIICALLGAPREDWQLFSVWAEHIIGAFSLNADLATDEATVLRAWAELDAYVDDMIERRRHQLTDDLLSALIRAEDDGDRLNAEELRMLAAGLLMAGTDTTRNQLAASIQVMCEHPDQWRALAADPSLAMRAVEETMRHSPAACFAPRIAKRDAECGGYTIPAGTFTMVNTFAANRDPAVYSEPDRFDIGRESAPAILTFGGGVHYCLGANLARLELAEALAILARRLPDLQRAGAAPWKPILGMTGPTSLPVEFGAAVHA